MKTKQLRRLVYQFGRFNTRLTSEGIARRLESAGLIERHGLRYVETQAMREIERQDFDKIISDLLKG